MPVDHQHRLPDRFPDLKDHWNKSVRSRQCCRPSQQDISLDYCPKCASLQNGTRLIRLLELHHVAFKQGTFPIDPQKGWCWSEASLCAVSIMEMLWAALWLHYGRRWLPKWDLQRRDNLWNLFIQGKEPFLSKGQIGSWFLLSFIKERRFLAPP